MKDKVLAYLREAGGSYYSFEKEAYLPYYDEYIRSGRTYIPMPTYRELARALSIPMAEVRMHIAALEREGKAVKPRWLWKRKIGTLVFRGDDGRERTLEAYAGENCCFLLLAVRSRFDYDIVEVFDSKKRFFDCFDTWIVYGYGDTARPGMIREKKLYGKDDFVKWTVNVHDSAWPGIEIARALDKAVYRVETYDERIVY